MISMLRTLCFMIIILLCSVFIIASNEQINENLPQRFLSNYKSILNSITKSAIIAIKYRFNIMDPKTFQAGKPLSIHSSSSYTMTTRKSCDCTNKLLKIGAIFEEVVRQLKKRCHLTSSQIPLLQNLDLKDTLLKKLLDKSCIKPITFCDPFEKFRSIDGSCNNIANPQWGRAMTGQKRFLTSDFTDGISLPRNTSSLPSPRFVSVKIHSNLDIPASHFTAMVFQFGQFVDHDLILTTSQPISTGESRGDMKMPDCCRTSSQTDACLMPIEIREDDEFYHQFNKICLHFSRSSYVPNFGPRSAINQNTAYLDGSAIYGSSLSKSLSLRDTNGRLKVTTSAGQKDLLPGLDDINICEPKNGKKCFFAGDIRANEQRALTSLHTIWMREHNRIAGILSKVNPKWKDEQIFQETRKIVIAMLQHIFFNEFLPVILGSQNIKKFGLNVGDNSFKYSPTTDASITLGFSSAAFRFGHSLIPSLLSLTQNNFANLSTLFDNPFALYETNHIVDKHILGLINQKSQSFDVNVVHEVTRMLFMKPGCYFGTDLAAINIQRGRDHGIPKYTVWLEYCTSIKVNSFKDIPDKIMSEENLNRLKGVYRSVHDIDLFPGGLSERNVKDGVVGPTFACILGKQFKRLREGDRFWYENKKEVGFTEAQLNEIRKITLGRVICNNIGASESDLVQKNTVMLVPSSSNPLVPCNELMSINLSSW